MSTPIWSEISRCPVARVTPPDSNLHPYPPNTPVSVNFPKTGYVSGLGLSWQCPRKWAPLCSDYSENAQKNGKLYPKNLVNILTPEFLQTMFGYNCVDYCPNFQGLFYLLFFDGLNVLFFRGEGNKFSLLIVYHLCLKSIIGVLYKTP